MPTAWLETWLSPLGVPGAIPAFLEEEEGGIVVVPEPAVHTWQVAAPTVVLGTATVIPQPSIQIWNLPAVIGAVWVDGEVVVRPVVTGDVELYAVLASKSPELRPTTTTISEQINSLQDRRLLLSVKVYNGLMAAIRLRKP